MHQWLAKTRSKAEKARIAAVGNVVVPVMAYYAMNILCHEA